MRQSKPMKMFLILVFIFGISTDSWADLIGSGIISYNNGLYASGDNWANTGTSLSWNVYHLSNGSFEYDYSFTLPGNANNISHVITQVSDNFTAADMLSGTTPGGIIGTWDGQGQSNLGLPDSLYGIKWDMSGQVTSFSWTIVTDHAPMMGNFYAKDGNVNGGVYAYSGTNGLFGNSVMVPDSITPVPIPAAAWLFGSGLIGLGVIRKKDTQNSSANDTKKCM